MNAQRNWFKIIVITLLVGIGANLAFLDYQFIQSQPLSGLLSASPPTVSSEAVIPVDLSDTQNSTVDYARIFESIKSATESVTLKVNVLAQTVNQETEETPVAAPVPQAASQIREYYIPLGSGSTNSTEWIDLPGVEAYVAPANYGKITAFYFEAGIRIPTGNGQVLARLKNVTDNVTLFESEVFREGTHGGLVSSGKIPIPSTTKLYRVQLRSSIGADVVLDNARIKLFAQ